MRNKKLKYFILLGLIIFVFFIMRKGIRTSFDDKHYNEELGFEIFSIIDSTKQIGKTAHFAIYFKDGSKWVTPFSYGLWIRASVGDSVVKRKNENYYLIYELNPVVLKDTFYFKKE